ncbi:TonB-dependent receptor plug domain-containing protein, partial [Azotobacter chroococcum]|nr:TonB-dependent receptor plug domain-containing protein [Azotobacter chroococcum]
MIRKPSFGPAASALLGLFSLSPAQAADEPLSLDATVVTAARSAQTLRDSLAAVSLIERDDIERSQAQSVPELLRQVPGVSIANNGGHGKSTSVYL